MKKLFTVVMTLLIVGVLALPSVAVAQAPARVTGGGTVDPGALTQFGFSVTGNTGHFECLMAGLFPGGGPFIPCPGDDCVMIVEGKVTSLDSVTATTANFSGTARVILSDAYQDALGMDRINTGVPFHVHVTEGGAGVGTLQLHIFAMHIPADPGTVNSGNIVIQP
jgi:hypothetical protein